jgi:transcriptional regulator with XRE-family HTH domain/TPR repeat protein
MSELLLPPEDAPVLVHLLRTWKGRNNTQESFAQAARLNPRSLRRYEAGERVPRREALERMAAAAGVPLAVVESLIIPTLAALRRSGQDPTGGAVALEALIDFVRARLALLALGSPASPVPAPRPSTPEALWARLEPHPQAARRILVRHLPEFQQLPLVLWLCERSTEATPDPTASAMDILELAQWTADCLPGEGDLRARREGYVGAFVANAFRIQGQLESAETELHRARRRWDEGGDPGGKLPAWRFVDLEASLRRDQTRFREALAAHERALSLAPPEAHGRILLKKAFTYEQMGEPAKALATLAKAEQHLDATSEPRLRFGLEFNRLVNLLHLGRLEPAAHRLPRVREQARSLGELDRLRVRWLEAGLHAARAESAAAEAAYREVRQAFAERQIAYDFARVSLDLAVLYLRDRRWPEVQELARETCAIFAAQQVALDALASLKVFCEAAERQTATAELARRTAGALSGRHGLGVPAAPGPKTG